MPVKYRKFICREDLQQNPSVLYLFGDNDLRVGLGGQAREMRGEENAVGVRTKWAPDMAPSSFFTDASLDQIKAMIDHDLRAPIQHLKQGGLVVIPADGLGTGLSQLPQRAPQVNAYLVAQLAALEKIDGVIKRA
jgi:hypothetical protein